MVGHLGPPAGDLEPGQGVGGREQLLAQGPVGLADVGQLPAYGTVGDPGRRRAHGDGHQPHVGARDHDGLAGLDRLGVEAGGAAEAHEVALDREGRPERRRTLGPQSGQAAQQRLGAGAGAGAARGVGRSPQAEVAQARHGMGGLVADDGVEQQVGHHLAAQPGGAPPGQAGGDGEVGAHGARGYAGAGEAHG